MIRLKEAVSDLAETLRRVFQAPESRAVDPRLPQATPGQVSLLEVQALEATYRLEPQALQAPLVEAPNLAEAAMAFAPSLCQEDAWTRWAAGAQVCEMPVFMANRCPRLEVPALPRKAALRRGETGNFRVASRLLREPILPPGVRRQVAGFQTPGVQSGMRAMLGLPVAIAAMDLPKALGMRYTLQLVRATGENIRNLEVLGLYPIPVRGVRSLRHDGKTGRVLLELGPEASGSKRSPFILARKRNDLSFVSCFVEE